MYISFYCFASQQRRELGVATYDIYIFRECHFGAVPYLVGHYQDNLFFAVFAEAVPTNGDS